MSKFTDRRKFRKNNPEKVKSIPGQLGDGYGNLAVSGRPGYFYCRVAGNIEIVYNDRVPAQDDMLVDLGRDTITGSETPGIFKVLSTRTSSPAGAGGQVQVGYAPAKRYEIFAEGGGQDPLWVGQRQIMPLRIGPYSGMTIQVWFGVLWTGAAFVSVPWQTVDLAAHIPAGAGDAAFVLITIDTDGLVVDTKGDEFVLEDMTTAALMLANIPAAPADTCYICGAVRVYNGQTAVIEGRVNTDIVDARASANGGAPGGVTDGDKGDITVSSSGTVWRLRAQGAYNESTTASGVYAGIVSGTPRIMFANGTAAQNWQIDVDGDDFRWFRPASLRMVLSPDALTLADTTILLVEGSGTSLFNGSIEAGGHILAGGTVLGSNLSGTNTGDETTASIASKSIEDAINDGTTNKAPSENAVFDALALKTPSDGWIAATGTWTPRSQAYTNDPAAGSNISLSMANTGGFAVGDLVNVSSSAGNEDALITVVTTNTSITVDVLTLNHTTTTPLVRLSSALYLQRAYTNDPASGSNIALNMANTSGFSVGNKVMVTSSAGSELAVVTVVTTNTSITVNTLALNHTTTGPMVTIQCNYNYVVDTSADLSGSIQVGDKVKFTDTTVKQFIVHAISTTRITLFGGTDYSIVGTAAVTSPSYSHVKNPYGFNVDPDKWTLIRTDATSLSQSTPTADTVYNPGSFAISAPIGAWLTDYFVDLQLIMTQAAVAQLGVRASLSTTNNSISDGGWTNGYLIITPICTGLAHRLSVNSPRKILTVAARTTYYLVSTSSQSLTSLSFRGDTKVTTIRLVSAYL